MRRSALRQPSRTPSRLGLHPDRPHRVGSLRQYGRDGRVAPRHGLAFNYSILDRTGDAAVVEGAPKGVAVHRGAPTACTSNFRSATLASRKPGAKASSRQRLPPLEAMAAAGLDAEALFRALNGANSLAFHHGYARGFGTLHTVVCAPGAGMVLIGISADCAAFRVDVHAWAKGETLGASLLEGRIDTEQDWRFVGRNLAGAVFRDVSLAGARSDDINFTSAEITARCNFKEMRIAGVLVEELFAAYQRLKIEDR